MLQDVLMGYGQVTAVDQRSDGVFVEVALREHVEEDGDDLTARCTLGVGFHGAGYGGTWWVPDVGVDVICLFPGLSHDMHESGGNLDTGVVVGVIPTIQEPIPSGQQGALSASRTVWKGKAGAARDQHVQGDDDRAVDGDENVVVGGDADRQVSGDQTEDVGGTLTRTVGADEDQTVTGALTRVLGSLDSTIQGLETRQTTGALTWTLLGAATLTVAGILTLAAATIQLGTETLRRLIHEEFKTLFDSHTHPYFGGPNTGAPNEQIDLDDHATTQTTAA